ncbi:MAG: cyclic nucleotide-binding domain-containing protein [bacterium]
MYEFFKTNENFAQMSDEDKQIFAEHCTIKKVAKDEVLFKDGEHGDDVYIVKEGIIRISKKIRDDEVITLALSKAGMIFGEMAIFESILRYADAAALTNAELIVFDKKSFQHIREIHPKTALVIVDMIIRFLGFYLRKTTDRVYGIFLDKNQQEN